MKQVTLMQLFFHALKHKHCVVFQLVDPCSKFTKFKLKSLPNTIQELICNNGWTDCFKTTTELYKPLKLKFPLCYCNSIIRAKDTNIYLPNKLVTEIFLKSYGKFVFFALHNWISKNLILWYTTNGILIFFPVIVYNQNQQFFYL